MIDIRHLPAAPRLLDRPSLRALRQSLSANYGEIYGAADRVRLAHAVLGEISDESRNHAWELQAQRDNFELRANVLNGTPPGYVRLSSVIAWAAGCAYVWNVFC